MNTSRKNVVSLAPALMAALCASLFADPPGAAAASRCVVDQQMWINGGGDGFGDTGVPGQTFRPSASGRVCKVKVLISKNDAAAGDLQLVLRHSNFIPVPGGSATIPGAGIPMGLSVQTVDFCCDQPVLNLAVSPFFGLTLAAPTSDLADYTWINSDDAGADGVYLGGQGYYNNSGAAPGTRWTAAGYDYAFQIHMCRP